MRSLSNKYGVIYADPPWPFKNYPREKAGRLQLTPDAFIAHQHLLEERAGPELISLARRIA
jgi:hypothetical protein